MWSSSWEFLKLRQTPGQSIGRWFEARPPGGGTALFDLAGAIERPLPRGVEFCTESPSDTTMMSSRAESSGDSGYLVSDCQSSSLLVTTVEQLFQLGRRQVAKLAVEPFVFPPGDPGGRCKLEI